MAITTRNYTRGSYEATGAIALTDVGSGTNYFELDTFDFKFALADVGFYTDAGLTSAISTSDYTLTESQKYTTSEAATGGSGKTVYIQYQVTNATYQTGTIYISANSFGAFLDNDVTYSALSSASAAVVPVGAVMDFSGVSLPSSTWQWVPKAATTISRTTYADLFAAYGSTDIFAADATAASTAASSGNFHLPTLLDAYFRGGFHGEIASVDTGNDLVTMTDQLSGAIATADYRDGTPVRFIGSDLPAGITAYTTYYITWDAVNSGWKLYTTESDAVGDTGSNQLTLTDAGTGTQIATQYGINLDDAAQGHRHFGGMAGNANTADAHVYGTDSGDLPGSATGFVGRTVGTAENQALTSIMKSDDDNGTPRTTNETRVRTGHMTKIIRVL
jgi:hypothetical protein